MSLDLPPISRIEPSSEEEETPTSILPSTDRGLAAWKFLFACFVIEGVLWGKIQCPGYQRYPG